MTQIDDFKSDWNSLKKPTSPAGNEIDSSSLINDFERIQRQTKKENIIASIFFTLTIAFLWTMVLFMNNATWWVWSGLIILTAEIIAAMVFLWGRNSLKGWGDMQQSSYNYVSSAIKKLKYRRFLMLRMIPVYGLLLITAINLIYIDVISDLGLTLRWGIHLGVSILLAGFISFEINRRLKKERQQIDPLIEEFKTIKKALE